MKYVCVGHATYDITLPLPNFPIENKKIRLENKIECGGGPASNAAYLLAKWGMDTTFVGVVGNDYYGSNIIKEFNETGVNTEYIEKNSEIATDSSYIISNLSNGTRTIITSKNKTIDELIEPVDIKDADVILVDGEHYKTAINILNNNPNAISILDAGRVNEATIELGKMVTYLICSKDFAEEFTKQKIDYNNKESIITIYETLKLYFKTNIIITLESIGSFTKIDNYELIPSIKVKVLDSTGAGDIYNGAFTYFISNNYPLKEAIRLANITVAISVTKIGSRYAIPTLDEILEMTDNVELL